MPDIERKLLDTMAETSEVGVDGEFPKIRELRKVILEKHWAGYSFEFEAFVEGEWREYGPLCQGNWTCLRGHDCLPDDDALHWNRCFPEDRRPYFRTIGIGWFTIDRLFNALTEARARRLELPEEYQGVLAEESDEG